MGGLYIARAPLYYLTTALILKTLSLKETISQFYVARGFSFFLFVLTVYFTYLSAKLVFKSHVGYALSGVCFVGLLPQFLIISTSVNPINLVIFLSSVFLYIILYALYKGKNLWAVVLGPLIIAAGFFTHRAALFMMPPFLVYLLIVFVQSFKEKKKILKYLAVVGLLVVLIVGLYLASSSLLPDSFVEKVNRESGIRQLKSQWSRFFQYFTEGISADTSRTVSQFIDGFFKSFWFFAGWLRFGYLVDIYSLLMVFFILSVIGILKYIYSYIQMRITYVDYRGFLILLAVVLPIIIGTLIHCFPKHYAAQGRYLFPAISAIGILFVLGLKEVVPKKGERWVPLFVIFGFVVLNLYTIFHPLVRAFYFFRNF
jgi:4-amino-4-deoxy-L-arabinose transferase-like glycosyltransferase